MICCPLDGKWSRKINKRYLLISKGRQLEAFCLSLVVEPLLRLSLIPDCEFNRLLVRPQGLLPILLGQVLIFLNRHPSPLRHLHATRPLPRLPQHHHHHLHWHHRQLSQSFMQNSLHLLSLVFLADFRKESRLVETRLHCRRTI